MENLKYSQEYYLVSPVAIILDNENEKNECSPSASVV